MSICWKTLFYTQELPKKAPDKSLKTCSYGPGKKIWVCIKYIKTNQHRKLEIEFFGPFQVFQPVEKQAYKLELLTK